MGLFGRKKRTKVDVSVEKVTATKIVKMTYIESLLVDGGTAKVNEFAQETEATTNDFSQSKQGGNEITRFTKNFNDSFGSSGASRLVKLGVEVMLKGVTRVTDYLFGKKKTTTTAINVKDSGWSVVKSWRQPQFNIIRYALAIRELQVGNFVYAPVSEMISKPWRSPKEIVKLRITANQFIPTDFPPGTYIEYYIKPNSQEIDWIRINPIEISSAYSDNGSVVPRIITFNSEKPIGERVEERYFTTKEPVTSVRLKIIIRRPPDMPDTVTPIVKNYRILMTPRGGL